MRLLGVGSRVAGVMDVTQYYKRDPPIVSNNNIWLSCLNTGYDPGHYLGHFAILATFPLLYNYHEMGDM